ncbi:MAG: hypothetical protein IT257_11595, partial [Chitinophagaceae bacterium]|nr:hypothetical protein [Chitinophagaceae bacterium]
MKTKFVLLTHIPLFLIFMISASTLSAQKQSNIWYFGDGAGLDFNDSCKPRVLTNGAMNGFEGCATIADKSTGELLFYTNSEAVWNKNHQMMPNSSLIPGGSTITQVLIIERPGSNSQYSVITSEIMTYSGQHYRFHLIDMNLNGGLGGFVYKDSMLYNLQVSEKITAV